MKITIGELRQIVRESITENDGVIDEGWKDWKDKAKKLVTRWLPIATLSLSAVACDKDPNSFKCEGFTGEEIAIMQDAADEWCERTGNEHCVVLGEEGDSEVRLVAKVDVKQNAVGRGDAEDAVDTVGGHHFKGSNFTSDIEVKDMRSDPAWESKLHNIVMHELGHHFAKIMGHLKDGEGVMAPTLGTDYVTDKDVAYVKGDIPDNELVN